MSSSSLGEALSAATRSPSGRRGLCPLPCCTSSMARLLSVCQRLLLSFWQLPNQRQADEPEMTSMSTRCWPNHHTEPWQASVSIRRAGVACSVYVRLSA